MSSHKDASGAQVRRDLVMKLGTALIVFGSEVRRLTNEDMDLDRGKGLLPTGLIGSLGGELMATIGYLSAGRWAYGSAALVRQLVEIEYLSWATTNDPEDAWEWFTASRQTRLARWQPGKIRQRSEGRFPNSDYHDHCEMGGHPVPEPAIKILDNRDMWVELSLYEAALHGSATWHYLLRALRDFEPVEAVEEQHRIVDDAYERWKTVDPLVTASRTAKGN